MSAIVETPGNTNVDALVTQVTEVFANGGTLGDLFDYDDRDYEAVYALGHSFYAQARYLDALKAFAFLVMNNPYEKRFVNAYASSLQMLERYDDAIGFYSLASVMDIADPKPTFHTAECLLAKGRIEEATDALNIVIKQCKDPALDALKARAEALLGLLTSHKDA
jgi:type III secretion system low calcium response chaperone LcrH/SycD